MSNRGRKPFGLGYLKAPTLPRMRTTSSEDKRRECGERRIDSGDFVSPFVVCCKTRTQ